METNGDKDALRTNAQCSKLNAEDKLHQKNGFSN